MKHWCLQLSLFLIMFFTQFTLAQIPDSLEQNNDYLRVSIQCDFCDYNYFVENILFVNFVRDPHLAQVQIIISFEHTAGEGHKFNLRFIGRENFTGMEHTLFYNSIPTESDDQRRQGMTQVLKMGLMPYIAQTSLAQAIDLNYRAPSNRLTSVQMSDPWNYWVFQIETGGGLYAEELRNGFNIKSSAQANRITEQWRIGLDADFRYEEENVEDEEEGDIHSALEVREADVEVVKSLDQHWSAGVFGGVLSTTYSNIDAGFTFSPALQYNVFPWNESSHRILAVGYMIGVRSYRYIEETLYNKMNETLFYQSLGTQWEMIQPWGEIYFRLEGSHYLHDFSKNKLVWYTNISLRVVKGFSLDLGINLERIHDQIYLPKGEATLEEILLKRKQLATTFNYSSYFSLRYTFGSIYHNIVNRRLH
jgi:hypothetical protein